jgi:sulfopyruvate decarboxylase subunit alpha
MAGSEIVVAEAFVRGALRAGINACVYLPDSSLTPIIRVFQRSAGVTMVSCAREDEGVGIAVGLHLGGRNALCLMEASGIGFSGLILARAQVQRTPVIIVASHTAGAGEPFDYHSASALLSEGVFSGLGIPYEIARESRGLEALIYRVVQTSQGQLTSFGLLIPPFIAAGVDA